MQTLFRFLPLIGFVLLGYVLYSLDFQHLQTQLADVELLRLVAPLLFFAFSFGIRGLRWYRILVGLGINLPFGRVLSAYYSSQFYGSVTWGRAGELTRMKILTDDNHPAGFSFFAAMIDRALDVLLIAVMATILLIIHFGGSHNAPYVYAIVLFLLATFLVIFSLFGPSLIDALVERMTWGQSVLRAIQNFVHVAARFFRSISSLEAMAWTLFVWLFVCLTAWTIAPAANIAVSATGLFAAMFLAMGISLLPITMHGMGTRELVFAYVLGSEGISKESAVTLSLIVFLAMYLNSLLWGGLTVIGQQFHKGEQK